MSSTNTAPRFQTWVGQPSNLDQCQRCHAPRSAHGSDWSCPQALPPRMFVAPIVLGVNLALGGVIARLAASSAPAPEAMLFADAFLFGIILIVAGVFGVGRRG